MSVCVRHPEAANGDRRWGLELALVVLAKWPASASPHKAPTCMITRADREVEIVDAGLAAFD